MVLVDVDKYLTYSAFYGDVRHVRGDHLGWR